VTSAEAWNARRYLRRFRGYGRPHLPLLAAGVGLRIGELLADLAQPWPLAVVVDAVLGHKPVQGLVAVALGPFATSGLRLLTAAVIAAVVLTVLSGTLDYLGDRVLNGAGEKITAAIRSDLFAHLQRLPLAYHDQHAVGELVSRMSVDTARIEDALVDLFSTLLPALLSMGGLLMMMVILNWTLALVAAASTPLVFLTVSRYSRRTRQAARATRAREGALAGLVAEALAGIRTVQAFGHHELHDQRFAAANHQTLGAGLRAVELRARFTPLVQMCAALGTGAMLWIGAWGVLHGAWTVGVLLVALTYFRNLFRPVRSLSGLALTFSRAAASAERVAAVLDEPRAQARPSAPAPARLPARAQGRIELRRVSFSYGRGPVLKDVQLTVQAGERVAVLGPNGAGKSSILALLARLYEPDAGTILLDGQPLAQLPPAWLRRQIAVVLQDTFLFSGSLWENIAYGKPEARPEEVIAAAEQALVSSFAGDLPQGLHTMLGDRGRGLSGGQQQRVAIARALLRDAPVVLLDEPTSGLDLEAERIVVEALRSLMVGRTVVMATHRPALLALADRVLSLEAGTLLETAPLVR
jgi:ABC-type multidrug transport system fused ATPase/permease subunit